MVFTRFGVRTRFRGIVELRHMDLENMNRLKTLLRRVRAWRTDLSMYVTLSSTVVHSINESEDFRDDTEKFEEFLVKDQTANTALTPGPAYSRPYPAWMI